MYTIIFLCFFLGRLSPTKQAGRRKKTHKQRQRKRASFRLSERRSLPRAHRALLYSFKVHLNSVYVCKYLLYAAVRVTSDPLSSTLPRRLLTDLYSKRARCPPSVPGLFQMIVCLLAPRFCNLLFIDVCLFCASPVYSIDFVDMASDMAVVDYMLSLTFLGSTCSGKLFLLV